MTLAEAAIPQDTPPAGGASEADSPITSGEALRIIGRAMRYTFVFRFDLAVKAAAQMTSIFWILVLPWPAKVVIDYIVLRDTDPSATVESIPPFFFKPLLTLVEPLSAYQTVFIMGALFLLMVLLAGAYGTDGAQRSNTATELAQGQDTATKSENDANNMHSLVGGLFGLFEALWHIRITHRLNHRLRSELFGRFNAHRVTDFNDRSIGDVVYRGMYDTPSISSIIFNLWVGPATSAVNLATTILMMYLVFRNIPVVVWCALAVAPMSFLGVLYFARVMRRQGTLAREAGSVTTATIEEEMANVMVVQGMGSDKEDHARFAAASADSFKRFRGVVLVEVLSGFTTTVISVCMIFLVFYFLAPEFIEGRLAPGDWWVIWGYFGAIAASSIYLGRLWFSLQENVTGMRRVFAILDAPVEALEGDLERQEFDDAFALTEGVRLEGVDYDYPDGTRALTGIDFEGSIGQMVALAGPTGAGKSTLAYLIPALLTPTSGRYYLDGRQLTPFDLAAVRRQVAFVFQETSIFNDTIEGNIRMGRREATDEELREAARVAGVDDFIDSLEEGYDTHLGRAGAKLSVGQKQRIAIARALVSNKPILILDEPTAALDPQTENRLMANLREARAGRLVIVIAHRLSTIRSADRIYFLDEGTVVESGTHAELVATGGTYATFVELQSGRTA